MNGENLKLIYDTNIVANRLALLHVRNIANSSLGPEVDYPDCI